jgi:hypothetical protein
MNSVDSMLLYYIELFFLIPIVTPTFGIGFGTVGYSLILQTPIFYATFFEQRTIADLEGMSSVIKKGRPLVSNVWV